jgi:hypothetical protein
MSLFVRVIATSMVVSMIMLVGSLDSAGSRLLFDGLGSRFGGLPGLLLSDGQWVAFRSALDRRLQTSSLKERRRGVKPLGSLSLSRQLSLASL